MVNDGGLRSSKAMCGKCNDGGGQLSLNDLLIGTHCFHVKQSLFFFLSRFPVIFCNKVALFASKKNSVHVSENPNPCMF